MANETALQQSAIDRFGGLPPTAAAPWLDSLRRDGQARFAELGLPTPRLESWKYTNLRDLGALGFSPSSDEPSLPGSSVPSLLSADWHSYRLVLVDGRGRPDLARLDDLPEGVTLTSLSDALSSTPALLEANLGRIADGSDQALLALNDGLLADGFLLHVAPGVTVDHPIELIFLHSKAEAPIASHPRGLLVLEHAATATVIEHHIDLDEQSYLTNLATEVSLATNARLRHLRVQQDSRKAYHLATTHARVATEATFDSFTLSLGGRLSRNEVGVRLEGEGARCRLSGAYLMSGKQHCDTTTRIDHLVPNTSCREVFKGVLDDEARAVFQGLIKVHPDAQQTDGHQLSKALLLSDRAEIDAKPELEIYADDVKCSHGATAGELDPEALFYLRSRGLSEARARVLLIQSFLAEALNEISQERLRGRLHNEIVQWLDALEQGKRGDGDD